MMKHFYSILFCLVLSVACFSQMNRLGCSYGTTLSTTQPFRNSRISFAIAYQNNQSMFFRNPYANSYSMYVQLTAPCKFLKYSAVTMALAIQVFGGYTCSPMDYPQSKYFNNYNYFPYYFPSSEFYPVTGIGK